MAIGGLAAVALAVSGTVLLVASYVTKGWQGVLIGGCTGCLFGGLWFAYPLIRRELSQRRSGSPAVPKMTE
jgi:threonine/homoserine efflux transporter RhtA